MFLSIPYRIYCHFVIGAQPQILSTIAKEINALIVNNLSFFPMAHSVSACLDYLFTYSQT